MSAAAAHSIGFTLGSRRLFAVPRDLLTVPIDLPQLIAGDLPALPPCPDGCDGYRILSAPQGRVAGLLAAHPGFVPGGMQSYRRHYIDMRGGFDDYMAQFSGKTRSTLRRKRRKLEAECGGALDIRAYRSPAEIEQFLAHALPLSQRTYQARLLDAGLPEGEAARREMLALAEAGGLRAFLLFIHGEPAAYLYLPVEGSVLRYAYLGYDEAWAKLSPGTVLQLAALEQLYGERRFTHFDFTEGEGAHKALFGSASVAACSFFLLRRDAGNRLLLGALDGFDGAVAGARALAERSGALASMRRILRG